MGGFLLAHWTQRGAAETPVGLGGTPTADVVSAGRRRMKIGLTGGAPGVARTVADAQRAPSAGEVMELARDNGFARGLADAVAAGAREVARAR